MDFVNRELGIVTANYDPSETSYHQVLNANCHHWENYCYLVLTANCRPSRSFAQLVRLPTDS